jgi:hypothetical protein
MAPLGVDSGDEAAAGDRSKLVALLLNFLRQYHIEGKDDSVRAMLQDIASDGREPRPLGSWGYLTARDVGEAVAAFEVWKAKGRVHMPAQYNSPTHKVDIPCFVTHQNEDGTLDLSHEAVLGNDSQLLKRRADALLVRPRIIEGWFVPALEDYDAYGGTCEQETADGAPPPTPPPQVVWMHHPFNGAEYHDGVGSPYLVLERGDEIEVKPTDASNGWAEGRVRRRARNGDIPAGPEEGWYPAEYARSHPPDAA